MPTFFSYDSLQYISNTRFDLPLIDCCHITMLFSEEWNTILRWCHHSSQHSEMPIRNSQNKLKGNSYTWLCVCTMNINMRRENVKRLSSSTPVSLSLPSYNYFLIQKIIKFDIRIIFWLCFFLLQRLGYGQLPLFLPPSLSYVFCLLKWSYLGLGHSLCVHMCTHACLYIQHTH